MRPKRNPALAKRTGSIWRLGVEAPARCIPRREDTHVCHRHRQVFRLRAVRPGRLPVSFVALTVVIDRTLSRMIGTAHYGGASAVALLPIGGGETLAVPRAGSATHHTSLLSPVRAKSITRAPVAQTNIQSASRPSIAARENAQVFWGRREPDRPRARTAGVAGGQNRARDELARGNA